MIDKHEKKENTWTEEIVVAGNEIVEHIKRIVAQGNVRRLVIKKSSGAVLVDVPLTAGALVGGAMILLTPILAAVGILAGVFTEMRLEIVREGSSEQKPE